MANYSAELHQLDDIQIVRLRDTARSAEVSIAVTVGNVAYEWKTAGESLLYFPFDSPAAFRKTPALCGVPLLAPWANRLDEDGFWANGVHYQFNPAVGNLRRDGHGKPIHGLLNFSPKWELLDTGGGDDSAFSRARLEFWKHPEMIAQFPFAHTITLTHRLRNGALEVETALQNHSADPMPVSIGFHPYFRPPGARDAWKLHLPVTQHWKLNELSIPTGEIEPLTSLDTDLHGRQFDDVYSGLTRDPSGFAHCTVETGARKLTVSFGPHYSTAVLYAPPNRDYICFEPMAAITNALNLAHAGSYKDLQSIPPAATWREVFRMEFQ